MIFSVTLSFVCFLNLTGTGFSLFCSISSGYGWTKSLAYVVSRWCLSCPGTCFGNEPVLRSSSRRVLFSKSIISFLDCILKYSRFSASNLRASSCLLLVSVSAENFLLILLSYQMYEIMFIYHNSYIRGNVSW